MSADLASQTVSFTQMKDGTGDGYIMLHELEKKHFAGTAEHISKKS